MFIQPGKNTGVSAVPTRGSGPVELAHYLRQYAITRQRQSSRLNHWCRKHHPMPDTPHPWKH